MAPKAGSFNGLSIGTGTQLPIADLKGWLDMPAIRNRDTPRPASDGDSSAPDLSAGRIVRVTLGLRGDNSANLEELRQLVLSAFPVSSSALPLVINDRQVFAKVRRRDIEDDLSAPWRLGSADLEFYCSDSRVYSAGENTQTTGLAVSAGGLAFPWTFPISFGAGPTGGAIAVLNSGNAPTPVKITYSGGQLTNPGSTQLETGRRLKMGLTIGMTENLTLDTGAHTVLLNGATSRRSFLNVDQWFTVPPGTSTITFETDASTGVPQMEIKWRSAWL